MLTINGCSLTHRRRCRSRARGEERVVGAVVLVSEEEGSVYAQAAGLADRASKRPMRRDAIFLLSSLTKPIVAATALAMIEQGILHFDDPVTRWLPDFKPKLADGRAPTITTRHLLTHTAGLGYGFFQPPGSAYHRLSVSDGMDAPGRLLDDNLSRLASAPLAFAPGEGWAYSLALDVLGGVIARGPWRSVGRCRETIRHWAARDERHGVCCQRS